jgi:hypothetical protein
MGARARRNTHLNSANAGRWALVRLELSYGSGARGSALRNHSFADCAHLFDIGDALKDFFNTVLSERAHIQAVHRVRFELSNQRKAKANQFRGLVSEYGLVAPKELVHLRAAIPNWLEDAENGLTDRFRRLLNGLWHDMRALDQRVMELDREMAQIAASDPVAKRLQQLRGVGPMIATAIVAKVRASVIEVFAGCGKLRFRDHQGGFDGSGVRRCDSRNSSGRASSGGGAGIDGRRGSFGVGARRLTSGLQWTRLGAVSGEGDADARDLRKRIDSYGKSRGPLTGATSNSPYRP